MSNVVLLTGFGPFGDHKVNASWAAVQLVPKYNTESVNIVVEEIPVIYNVVDTLVPNLWKKHNPMLVVHVGVSSEARKITIESQAFRTGYFKSDCAGKQQQLNEACSVNEGRDCIKAQLNVATICNLLNETTSVQACISENAGRYLCEYIFYKSLSIDAQKTLFVHVPPLNNPYTADELATALLFIVKCALQQLNTC